MQRGTELYVRKIVTLGQDYTFRAFVGLDGTPTNPIGVLRNPGLTGEPGEVVMLGTTYCRVGVGGVTAGNGVKPDTDGTAIACTSGDVRSGIAVSTTIQGDDAEILVLQETIEP